MTIIVKQTLVPVPAATKVVTKIASPVVTTTASAKTKVANPVTTTAVAVAVKSPIAPTAPVAVQNTHKVAGSDTTQPATVATKPKTVTTSKTVDIQTSGHASYL